MQLGHYDLGDPTLLFRADVLDDPTPLYAQLRAEAPVWEIPGSRTFLVSSTALVCDALARPQDFSSNLTSLIHRGADGAPAVFDMAPLGDATHVLATADPPTHTAHRRLVQPMLAPGVVGRLEDEVRALAAELQGPLLAAGGGDYVAEVADLLPMRVISRVIGLPAEDAPRLVRLVLDVDQILAGVSDVDAMARAAASAMEQGVYLAGHLQRVLADAGGGASGGGPDTMLELIADAVRAGTLSFEEGVGVLVQMLGAGSETTTSIIGTAVRRLAEDVELQSRLRRSPDLVPAFVEEMLRLDGPFRFHYRSTPHDTHLGGVAIPAGSRVLMLWAAANLDEDAHREPDRLDLSRPTLRQHLAFGRGLHFCVGAPLARLEARLALTELLAATTEIVLDPAVPPRHHPDIFLRRLQTLRLRVVTGGAGAPHGARQA
jgi:cytochrome P450 family 144